MIGFDCELSGITEISQEDLEPIPFSRNAKSGEISGSFASEFSLDHDKLVGNDDEEEVLTQISTTSGGEGQDINKSKKRTKNKIKIAKIEIREEDGSLTAQQAKEIKQSLEEIEGVVNVAASIEQMPNEIVVQFRLSTVALRDIIEHIHDIGYKSAVYAPEKDKDDIR